MSRPVLSPGPDHPISIDGDRQHVRLTADGDFIADGFALALQEAGYPAVYYVERSTLETTALTRSHKTTWCPYKGEATHYHLTLANGSVLENAVWSYEDPLPAVAAIKDYLAFYPDVMVTRV
jgi:uncharacterized protein (DUF427 family)